MSATFSTLFFLSALLFSCFASVCLSCSSFAYDNHIRLAVDGLHGDESDDCDPTFSSLPIEAIYQFGDSISDTGNLIREDPSCDSGKWPYGESFSTKPTGRFSDGLLIIDYFAKFVSLPFIEPYLKKDGNFTHGVNFAVGGATALNASTLKQKYNIFATTNHTLSPQLAWFNSHLHSFYHDISEKRRKLAKSLFMIGGVGGNDYNYAILQGIALPNVYEMVPQVVQVIRNAVEEIIELGATHIVVPGIFPIGCAPMYLDLFKTNDSSMYDELKCLKKYNDHANFHNDFLQQSIVELQMDHPHVAIVYMDYFGTLKEILRNAAVLGFDENALEERCCGSLGKGCGTSGAPVCKNPQDHISWDGLHLTQQAYHVMARQLVRSIFLAFQNVVHDLKAFE
ncbi:GDSL esterase/lipase At5g03980-like [Silene latifolia]|uniref:GDSL esterase/lipase At5g03980-like n=1 Tax=Silene latifolia TaxID=37657 RepID=UPI003D76DB20